MKPTKAEKLEDLLWGEGEAGKMLSPDVPALGSWCIPLAPVLPGAGQLRGTERGTQLLQLRRQPRPRQLLSSGFPSVTTNTGFSCHSSEAERRAAVPSSPGAYSESSSTAAPRKLLTLLILTEATRSTRVLRGFNGLSMASV